MNYTDSQLAELIEVGMDEYTGEWGEKEPQDTVAVPESAYITVEDCSLVGGMTDIAQCIVEEFSFIDMEITTEADYYFSILLRNYADGDVKDVCSSIVHLVLDNHIERFTITVHEQETYE